MALAIIVNGEPRELALLHPPATLTATLAALGLQGDRIAVERNGMITPRTTWDTVQMSAGDRLEIVHFVGGGC